MATESIGQVTEATGEVFAVRADGTQEPLSDGSPVYQGDVVQTGPASSVGIIFADNTTFSLDENASLVLDHLVYDPSSGEGSSAFSVLQGAFAFASGDIAHNAPDNMSVRTPVATIGIRGTKVAGEIHVNNEESFIVLLEGQIIVSNAGGTRVLAAPHEVTRVISFIDSPGAPAILSDDDIQQLLGNVIDTLPNLEDINPEAGPNGAGPGQGGTFRQNGEVDVNPLGGHDRVHARGDGGGLAGTDGSDTFSEDGDFVLPPRITIQSFGNVVEPENPGDSVLVAFTVHLLPPAPQVVTVNFVVNDGTAEQVDSGMPDFHVLTEGPLVFQPGQTSQSIVVEVFGDNVDELVENFSVNITSVEHALLGSSTAVGFITDDPVDIPKISISDAPTVLEPQGEGEVATAVFTVTLSEDKGPIVVPATVDFTTVGGSATSNADFVAQSGTITFVPGGPMTQTIEVQILDDNFFERLENFTVVLSNPTESAILDGVGVGTIENVDVAKASVLLGVEVSEAGGADDIANATFVVLLDQPSDRDLIVHFSAGEITQAEADANGFIAATAGSDFMVVGDGVVVIPAGTNSIDIPIVTFGDNLFEGNETFRLEITGVFFGDTGDAVTLTENSQTSGFATITDTDVLIDESFGATEQAAPLVGSIFANDNPIAEHGPLSVVSINGQAMGAGGSLTINTAIGGVFVIQVDGNFSYTAPADVVDGSVETFHYIAADSNGTQGDATLTITVAAVNDPPVAEADKTVTVVEDSAGNALNVPAPTDADFAFGGDLHTVTINAVPAEGTVTLADGVTAVDAGDVLTVAQLTGLLYTTAANDVDGGTLTYTVTDQAGATDSQTITLAITPVNDPPVAEADKTVTVSEDSSDNPLGVPAPTDIDFANEGDSHTITINAVPAEGTVTLADGVTAVDAGDVLTVAQLTGLLYTTAANDVDGGTLTYTVTDEAGATDSQTITLAITPVNDPPVADADKTVTVTEDSVANPLNISAPTDIDFANEGDEHVIVVTAVPNEGTITLADGVTKVLPGRSLSAVELEGLLYTTAANDVDGGTFSYTVTDQGGATDSQTVTLAITPVNDAPVVAPDQVLGFVEDSVNNPLNIALPTDVDFANEGDSHTITIDAVPAEGTVTLADGTPLQAGDTITPAELTGLLFSTAPDDVDGGIFTYTVTDSGGLTATQTLTLTIGAVNNPPMAEADKTVTVTEDSSDNALNITAPTDVDFANEGDVHTITIDAVPAEGVITLADGTTVVHAGDVITPAQLTGLLYDTAANDVDGGTFSYTVTDQGGATDSQTVTLAITPVNDPPVAEADKTVTVIEDSQDNALNISAPTDIDFTNEGDVHTVTIDAVPNEGTVTLANGTAVSVGDVLTVTQLTGLQYDTAANDVDGGVFSYTVTDQGGATDSQTVTLAVTSVNDEPVAQNDAYQVNEDGLLTVSAAAGVLANDSDPNDSPPNTLAATLVTGTSHGTLVLNANGSFSYDSDPNFNGIDSFTYLVSDNGGTANGGDNTGNVATVTITVNSVNDEPVALNDAYQVNEDGLLTVNAAGGVLANDEDPNDSPKNTLAATLVTGTSHGTLTLNADGSFSYDSDPNFNGIDSFTYRVSDDGGTARGGDDTGNVATVTITVNSVNDEPVALNDAYQVNEDNILTVGALTGVLANDDDPNDSPKNTLIATLVSGTSHGTLVLNANGSFSYDSDPNFNGIDSFTYRVSDDGGTARGGDDTGNVATVTITVNSVNDEPVALNDVYQVNEDNILTVGALTGVLANDDDPNDSPKNTLIATLVSGTSHGTLTLNADGSFSYDSDPNFNGIDSFTYRVSDDGGTARGGDDTGNVATVTITVNSVNDEPVAQNDTYQIDEDGVLSVNAATGVLSNDDDPNDSPKNTLIATLVSGTSHGTLTLNADGSFTYTPVANFNGSDSFSYRISDNGGTANGGDNVGNVATVSLTVNAVNDDPVLGAVGNKTVAEDNTLSFTLTASDVDSGDVGGETLSFSMSGAPAGATLSATTGLFSYTPGFDVSTLDGDAVFNVTFTVTDSGGLTDSETVALTILNVNRAPTITVTGDALYVEDSPPVLVLNDAVVTDPDSDDIVSATATLESNTILDAGFESLSLSASAAALAASLHVTVTGDGSEMLTFTATDIAVTPSQFESILEGVTYVDSADKPTIMDGSGAVIDRLIDFQVSDGGDPSNVAQASVSLEVLVERAAGVFFDTNTSADVQVVNLVITEGDGSTVVASETSDRAATGNDPAVAFQNPVDFNAGKDYLVAIDFDHGQGNTNIEEFDLVFDVNNNPINDPSNIFLQLHHSGNIQIGSGNSANDGVIWQIDGNVDSFSASPSIVFNEDPVDFNGDSVKDEVQVTLDSESSNTSYQLDFGLVPTTGADALFSNVDVLDISGSQTAEVNSVTIHAQDVLDVTDSGNVLAVTGDNDVLVLSGGSGDFVLQGQDTINGATFNHYAVDNGGGGVGTLLVDTHITVQSDVIV